MSESLFITHPSWIEHTGYFHNVWIAWWGKSENAAALSAGKVVNLGSIPLKFIEPTVGRLTIREYHSQLFARLQQLDTYLPGGVVHPASRAQARPTPSSSSCSRRWQRASPYSSFRPTTSPTISLRRVSSRTRSATRIVYMNSRTQIEASRVRGRL